MAKPRIQILVCSNQRPEGAQKPSCGHRGGLEVYRAFKDGVRRLGLRADVMVVRSGCQKHCSRGVVVTIWPRNLWYRDVAINDVEEILQKSVLAEKEVDRLTMPDIAWE
jgi:(2Fe-2S) ferredoxin